MAENLLGRAPSRSARPVAIGFLTLGLLYPAIRLVVSLLGSFDRVRQDFADDAYYYALIADNIASGNGSTFGGLTETNGYQPLWQFLLVPIAALADGDNQVRLTLLLSAAFFVCFVLLIWRIARNLHATTEGLYAALFTVILGTVLGNQFFNGMEFAVVVPAGALLIALLLKAPWYQEEAPQSTRYSVVLGLTILALGLGRLDALAFPAAYTLVAIAWSRDRSAWTTWAKALAVSGVGLAAYAIFNVVTFETAVPVSGLTKALGGGTPESAAELLKTYLRFGEFGPIAPLWLGAQAIAVTAAALWLLRPARDGLAPLFNFAQDSALRHILWSLALAQAIQLGYYAVTSSWPFWPWYYYYIPLQFLVGGLVVMRAVLRGDWLRGLARPVVAAGLTLVLVVSALTLFVRNDERSAWYTTGPDIGRWIADNTPPDAVIAMGDRAGGVLWASNRRAVQVEGLVEDRNFLEAIEGQRIAEYLVQESVDFYVRGGTLGDEEGTAVPGLLGCWSFAEPSQGSGPKSAVVVCDDDLVLRRTQDDGSIWRIWSFRPELQDRS